MACSLLIAACFPDLGRLDPAWGWLPANAQSPARCANEQLARHEQPTRPGSERDMDVPFHPIHVTHYTFLPSLKRLPRPTFERHITFHPISTLPRTFHPTPFSPHQPVPPYSSSLTRLMLSRTMTNPFKGRHALERYFPSPSVAGG
jgi:hypothetical protein